MIKEIKEYWDLEETALSEHYFIEGGELEGEFKSYHPNGDKWEQSFYKEGERRGEYNIWHKNGTEYKCYYTKYGEYFVSEEDYKEFCINELVESWSW